jgi:hypothetical protein
MEFCLLEGGVLHQLALTGCFGMRAAAGDNQ